MVLHENDRRLLDQCLANDPHAWERFVDRFSGLVLHVVDHTALEFGRRLPPADREDLAAEVFLGIVANDFRTLRGFRGESSLATYLSVISRRIVTRQFASLSTDHAALGDAGELADPSPSEETRLEDVEELRQLMARLQGSEADVMRLYHLEGKSYREISVQTGVPENSIGPTLSRARSKLHALRTDSLSH